MVNFARIDYYDEFSDKDGSLEETEIDGHLVYVLYSYLKLGGILGVYYRAAGFASIDPKATYTNLVAFCEADDNYPYPC